ncbi:hypothetical protein BDEG_23329 [Batrachochytrium dendrobatidis JEL423]|uniref:Uncharacterized protein n=1 Tax=Batrachochytrium dendrobatidis (strain JEL423) TaxID=403673 RepID=A0A177WJ18_BATDL|nr:hypothetical protein BDEG_23329 [Batrachochytrium dendrobatidis JEL423]
MENKVFYIKYLDNQSVKIKTHFDGELERKTPIYSVLKLIAAYKTATTPLLDAIPVDELTLHYVVNGPAIAWNEPLASIQHPVGFYGHSLIIKSRSGVNVVKFSNPNQIPMSAIDLLEWLSGSNNSFTVDLADKQVLSQQQTNLNQKVVFPLAGREKSLQHIASCFMATYRHRSNIDRNLRPVPVCTECSITVLDMTETQGKRLSASFLLEMTRTHMAKLTSSLESNVHFPGDCSIRFSRRNTCLMIGCVESHQRTEASSQCN